MPKALVVGEPTTTMTTYLPISLKVALEQVSSASGLSKSAIMCQALRQQLTRITAAK
jgi:predicted transcriptional regulator